MDCSKCWNNVPAFQWRTIAHTTSVGVTSTGFTKSCVNFAILSWDWFGHAFSLHVGGVSCPIEAVNIGFFSSHPSPPAVEEFHNTEHPHSCAGAARNRSEEKINQSGISGQLLPSYCISLTRSLLRVINVKIPLHPQNMTSHSMENLAFHSLLRWKMIIIQILATPLMHFLFKRLGECTFWAQEWKG